MIAVILPFWSNFLIRVYAWVMLLGNEGLVTGTLNRILEFFSFSPVTLLHTPFAVLLGLVSVHLPFMILPLYANLEKMDMSVVDAAQDLGANAWQRFWQVIFPLSKSGIAAGSALVFIPALGMFAVPEILGGIDSMMIGNEIKQMFLDRRDW